MFGERGEQRGVNRADDAGLAPFRRRGAHFPAARGIAIGELDALRGGDSELGGGDQFRVPRQNGVTHEVIGQHDRRAAAARRPVGQQSVKRFKCAGPHRLAVFRNAVAGVLADDRVATQTRPQARQFDATRRQADADGFRPQK